MNSSRVIHEITQEITPALEEALAIDSFTSKIPENLQLRYSQCGLATAALQLILLEKYDISTERIINKLTDAPRGLNFRTMSHVALRSGNQIIDPTYGQFMNYIGLTHKTAVDHNIESLYPNQRIAVYNATESEQFADDFATHAHNLDVQGLIPTPTHEYSPDGTLRGVSFTEKQATYRSIWQPNNYRPFPLETQREDMQRAARQTSQLAQQIIG